MLEGNGEHLTRRAQARCRACRHERGPLPPVGTPPTGTGAHVVGVDVWGLTLWAGLAAMSSLLSPALTNDFDFTNNPEAIRAQKLLEAAGLEQDVSPETFVMTGDEGAVADPTFADQVNAALDDLRGLDPDVVLSVPSAFPLPVHVGSNARTLGTPWASW